MNILQQEDIIKGLPDQALQEEAKSPSGQVPQFLVVSEIQRRTDMRNKYKDPNEEQPQGTIADQITQEGIASVQPQQPPQEEPQQMQAYGGGMTPFRRKYASGGVVRMATAGQVPRYPELTTFFQSLKDNGMTREDIMRKLKGQYIDNSGQASDPFATTTDPTSIIQGEQRASGQETDNLKITDLFREGTPMSEAFDGVFSDDDTTFEGAPKIEAVLASGEPSVDTLEQFSNAFQEDASRANYLLATLDDSTEEEKEAIINPVNVNLPKQVNANKDSFSGLGFDQEKDTSIEEILAESQNALRGMSTKDRINDMLSDIPSGYSSRYEGEDNHQAKMRARERRNAGTLLDYSPFSPFSRGDQRIASRDFKFAPGNTNLLNRGMGGGDDLIRDKNAVVVSANETLDLAGNDLEVNDLAVNDLEVNDLAVNDLAGDEYENLGPEFDDPLGKGQVGFVAPVEDKSFYANTRDGANNEGSGDIGVNNSNKAVNLLNNAFKFDLDASKKEAFAMAMIQLGAGIAKGDLAEGLSNAGVAASGVLESARDRSDKQLDREIQRKYYDDKLSDSRLARNESLKSRAQVEASKMMAAWYKTPAASKAISDPSIASDQEETYYQLALKRLTQAATGEDMKSGGSESDRIMSYSPSKGLQSPT